MQGFLNLNKPFGLTSHDCVARVRRLLRTKRVGHGGTLDPAATGVLPIALGQATRLLQYLSHSKAYRAKIRFGLTTSTDDLEGEILSQNDASQLTLAQVQPFLAQFQGQIEQIPPAYSAIQVGGKRLYDLARAGQLVEAPLRVVEVKQIEVLDWHKGPTPELEVAITCGAGTYIRSIARDLGAAVGTGGTLASLIRTASSGFHLPDSLTLEDLAIQIESDSFTPISPQAALTHLPSLTLPDLLVKPWQQGQKLSQQKLSQSVLQLNTPNLQVSTIYQVHHPNGSFLGIGQIQQGESEFLLAPKIVWN
jgi:tRNA pseudouridine55 synthase